MLATRGDEVIARKSACHAMSGIGVIDLAPTWQSISPFGPSPLDPAPYSSIPSESPTPLSTSPVRSLTPPEAEPIPVKKPFDWTSFGTNITGLIQTYGQIDAAREGAEAAEAEAARQQQIAAASKEAAEAKARAAAAQGGVARAKTGMGTGTMVGIGVGVLITAFVLFKVMK